MLASLTEAKIALRNLSILEAALVEIRAQITITNPNLLSVTAPTYLRSMTTLQSEIANYLYSHPADVSNLARSLPMTVGAA